MITADAIQRASQWLPAHSTVTTRVYPDLAHGISDQEVDDVRTFLTRQLYAGLPKSAKSQDPEHCYAERPVAPVNAPALLSPRLQGERARVSPGRDRRRKGRVWIP
jgi:hypothetical protein